MDKVPVSLNVHKEYFEFVKTIYRDFGFSCPEDYIEAVLNGAVREEMYYRYQIEDMPKFTVDDLLITDDFPYDFDFDIPF